MAANERSSLLSSPPVFMTTYNSTPPTSANRTLDSEPAPQYEAPHLLPPPPPPAVATGQFPVSQRFEKQSVMLDVDITFLASSQTSLTLPNPRKLRLQINPGVCVIMLSPLILRRVPIPPPFTYLAFVAKTSGGYELADNDPVGEVADRGDFLRACACAGQLRTGCAGGAHIAPPSRSHPRPQCRRRALPSAASGELLLLHRRVNVLSLHSRSVLAAAGLLQVGRATAESCDGTRPLARRRATRKLGSYAAAAAARARPTPRR